MEISKLPVPLSLALPGSASRVTISGLNLFLIWIWIEAPPRRVLGCFELHKQSMSCKMDICFPLLAFEIPVIPGHFINAAKSSVVYGGLWGVTNKLSYVMNKLMSDIKLGGQHD